jgi:stage II sporulation protein Q
MNEEKNGASKNKWSRIFRKKWFFPALYLTIAALLLSVVVWYQNIDNQIPDAQKKQDGTEDFVPNLHDGDDAQSVLDQQEVIKTPVTEADQDQAEIVTKFYDYNAEKADQENALVLYNNRYYQSTGVDIATADDDAFEVTAALSGTVEEVKEDPLLGNVVSLTHENDVKTYYASLGDIAVKAGDEVKQGDKLGVAGKNLFGKDVGTHVHFQLRKDDKVVNPESFFNQPVSKLDSTADEDVDAKEKADTNKDADKEEDADKEKDADKEDSNISDEKDQQDDMEKAPSEDQDTDADKDDAENENPDQEEDSASDSSASA